MAYEKHTWVCGEQITDTLMNNMEEGIEEANSKVRYVHITQATGGDTAYTADMTFSEIVSAYQNGDAIFAVELYGDVAVIYHINFVNPNSVVEFERNQASSINNTVTLAHYELLIDSTDAVVMNAFAGSLSNA